MIRATLRGRSFSQKTAVLRDVRRCPVRRARSRLARLWTSGFENCLNDRFDDGSLLGARVREIVAACTIDYERGGEMTASKRRARVVSPGSAIGGKTRWRPKAVGAGRRFA
jgi:hypothetical protein